MLPLGETAVASAADVAIQNKIYGLDMTTLIISNEEMKDILALIKRLVLLVKCISKIIENKAKKQKGGFLPLLLVTLGAILLGSLLSSKGVIRAGEGTIRACLDFIMMPHPLTNLEVQKYYQNKPKFNGVYSRNSLSKVKDGTYITSLDEYKSVGTHRIASYVNVDNVTYSDNFEVKYIPKEIKEFIGKPVDVNSSAYFDSGIENND